MFKKLLSGIMAIAVCVVGLSGCGESQTEETTSETTTEVTTAKYSEEELEQMAQNMPEIVFVMSHNYDGSNILGYYITNTGEIKLYDFRQISPNETYEIPDVYYRLEEAVCDEIAPYMYWDEISYQEQLITKNELGKVSNLELIDKYKMLLQIDINSDYIVFDSMLDLEESYKGYGIRNNSNNEKEFVLLLSHGKEIYQSYDEYANELFSWLRFGELFPTIPNYQ